MSGDLNLSEREEQLAALGRHYLEMLAPGLEFGVEPLPDEHAVYVWQLGFGGSQIIVGEDESLLFGTSALWRDPMIEIWRTGKRTPAADFAAAAAQRSDQ
jgi:hypothetical protein